MPQIFRLVQIPSFGQQNFSFIEESAPDCGNFVLPVGNFATAVGNPAAAVGNFTIKGGNSAPKEALIYSIGNKSALL
jgi:hypothetical protein